MATRTLKETVQRIVAGLGENPPSTVITPGQTVEVAVDAVNDAVADIYGRTKWPFRLKFAGIDLIAGSGVYALPDDFSEFQLSRISVPNSTADMRYVEYSDLVDANPGWIVYGPGVSPGDIGLIGEAAEFMLDNAGTPTMFTEWNTSLVLWPPPDADFVAAHASLSITYYKQPPELTLDADLLPLPQNLWAGCTAMAQALLKQYLEYPDFKVDENRAERLITKQMSRKLLVPRRTILMKVR